MPDEVLLLVKRAEGCECPDLGRQCTAILLGWWRPMPGVPGFSWSSCGHGSTVAVIPAQVVECEECGGSGQVGMLAVDPKAKVTRRCEECLGTGLCLAPEEAADV